MLSCMQMRKLNNRCRYIMYREALSNIYIKCYEIRLVILFDTLLNVEKILNSEFLDTLQIIDICFGVQSIKHANVLSEKINFSALGGSKVAIFGGDGLDPLHFEVHMFLDPPDPPYMSKNAKMCYFEHFFGVRWKKPPQSRGPP